MDQNQSQSQNKTGGFWQKNQNYIIAGVIVVLLIIYFATRGNDAADQQTQDNPKTEQSSSESTQGNSETSPPAAPSPTPAQTPATPAPAPAATSPATQSGTKVSAVGTLKASDNQAKGNLVLESSLGKVYISTKRDYSAWIDKQVTLDAEGSLSSFVFRGFAEAQPATVAATPSPATDTTAVGGGEPVTAGKVEFSGKLERSGNEVKGNYQVVSGGKTVYLQTSRDYSALVGGEVAVTATGTMASFASAAVTKK